MKWFSTKKLAGYFTCWFSFWYYDIHTEKDDIKKVPDIYKQYTCQRCGKIFKL